MRAAFGLVGILAVVGVIVWFLGRPGGGLDQTKTVLDTGQRVRQDVNQLGGQARDGAMSFKESIGVEEQSTGGRTVALLVTSIAAEGPAAAHFGLKRGDMITEIGPLPVKEMSGDAGIDYLQEAYQRRGEITVVRDEKTIKLPGGAAAPAAPTAQQAAAPQPQAAPPPKPPQDDRGSLQRQLDNITNAGQGAGTPPK
jgi:hypothetical protein